MKKYVAVFLGSSLLLLSLSQMYSSDESGRSSPPIETQACIEEPLELRKVFSVDQERLQLDHEYVQYRLRFHENVSVTIKMNITHDMLDFQPVCYRMYLTNGTGFVTNHSFILDTQILAGMLFDLSVFHHRVAIGGRGFIKHVPYGLMQTRNETAHALKGDTWYLTLIVLRKKIEVMSFSAEATTPCMEVDQVTRGSNLGFYSAWDGDFDGRYFGIRLIPLTPFGFSIARVNKTITTRSGTIFEFISAFHLRGGITITTPDSQVVTQSGPHGCVLMGSLNLSGEWRFSARGVGLPYKHLVMLFYADVDPHLSLKAPSSPDINPMILRTRLSYSIQG